MELLVTLWTARWAPRGTVIMFPRQDASRLEKSTRTYASATTRFYVGISGSKEEIREVSKEHSPRRLIPPLKFRAISKSDSAAPSLPDEIWPLFFAPIRIETYSRRRQIRFSVYSRKWKYLWNIFCYVRVTRSNCRKHVNATKAGNLRYMINLSNGRAKCGLRLFPRAGTPFVLPHVKLLPDITRRKQCRYE